MPQKDDKKYAINGEAVVHDKSNLEDTKTKGRTFLHTGIYTVYRYKPLLHLKKDHEVSPIIRSLLTENPPSPVKVGHTTRVYVPYSF